ncbi:MAG: flagellar hook-basal body complex protein FliE [Rhodobacterales bacterium]|nr:flagellar hook-basal body complex protein FliE [Rhodobacterales bacterium]MDX5501006.1 flagellar hook-basal body complex protein FliE [Rhodobacterales bacterium]
MDITSGLAASAYARARPATRPEPQSGPLAGMAQEFTDVLKAGEDTAMATMTGRADPHALVQALSATELAVETAVTLRDKVVEAYQEILRMPV